MACEPFTVDVGSDAVAVFECLRRTAIEAGGSFTGDAQSGSFGGSVPILGNVRGRYRVEGRHAIITITDSPWLVPCSLLESQMRDVIRDCIRARDRLRRG
jgi:hypothetical protein